MLFQRVMAGCYHGVITAAVEALECPDDGPRLIEALAADVPALPQSYAASGPEQPITARSSRVGQPL